MFDLQLIFTIHQGRVPDVRNHLLRRTCRLSDLCRREAHTRLTYSARVALS